MTTNYKNAKNPFPHLCTHTVPYGVCLTLSWLRRMMRFTFLLIALTTGTATFTQLYHEYFTTTIARVYYGSNDDNPTIPLLYRHGISAPAESIAASVG